MTAHPILKIVLGGVLALGVATRLGAQTLETESARVLPSHGWEVGYAFEAQTSYEGTERAMPLALEYGLSDKVELMVEPVAYTAIRPKAARKAIGAGDLEVTLTYKVRQESPRAPAWAVAGELKIPTARNQFIGTGRPDYAAYLSESKRIGRLDTHAHVSYTFVGQPSGAQLGNIVGFGLAAVYPASTRIDIYGEILSNTASTPGGEGGGPAGVGVPVVPEAAGGELVRTLGTAWHVKRWLTLYVSGSRDNIGATLLRSGFILRSH